VTGGFAFYPKKKSFISRTGTSGACSKRPPTVSVHQPLWYLLTPTPKPSTSSVMQTLEITHEDPHDPEQADEGDIQTEYSRLVVQPKYRKSNKKNTCKVLGQYKDCLQIWNSR